MQRPLRQSSAIAVAAVAGAVLAFAGWPHPHPPVEIAGLVLAAGLLSAVGRPWSNAEAGGIMAPSFVFHFTSLLLYGRDAAALVVAAGTAARALAYSPRSSPFRRALFDGAAAMVSLQAAGLVHGALGGMPRDFLSPWQTIPIVVAVLAYCLIKCVISGVARRIVARQPINRAWLQGALKGCPSYVVGAGVAVGFAHLVGNRSWEILPAAALPLYFLHRLYCDYGNRLLDEQRRREIIPALAEGISIVDGGGRVTHWNDALERILSCTRERAIGRSLAAAVPALGKTSLPAHIEEALQTRAPRTATISLSTTAGGSRVMQIALVPVVDGLTLVWHDATERSRVDRALKRIEERLMLVGDGANDGLWEWDLRTQDFYVSRRWREMLGAPASDETGRPADWTGRVHPEDVAPLKAALDAHLAGKTVHIEHEHRIRHADGTYRRFVCRGVAMRSTNGRPVRMAGSLTDTTEQALVQEQLRAAGFHDPLTGLCNRAVFVAGLGRQLEELKQRRLTGWFAVFYLDLDRFKIVNDSLGHLVGDELLIAVSRRLESFLKPGDALARLGGDEFALLLNGLGDGIQANAIAFRIQEALSAPIAVGGRDVFTSASIGIAFGGPQYANPDEIMRDADTAMYHAKARGKARHELFDADMHARTRDRLTLENDLRHAVTNNDFEVHYQPIVSLRSGMCVGFESLVRWKRSGTPVSPATFVPIAEELGLIESLGTNVLQQACRTFADWQRRFPDRGLDCITVNASSRQLMHQGFVRAVEHAVQDAGLKPCDLRIEITETALMDSPNVAAAVLSELRDFGVKIYLDDFGTGYSSLSHLHTLPVDALKIDASFVKSLLLPDRPAIVESILALARTLSTSVVAEGIESETQARELHRLGCTHAQGYLYSRPLSVEAVEKLLVTNQPLGPRPACSSTASAEPGVYYSTERFEWPDHIRALAKAGASGVR
jgi:diguanylate cyclase (GGDEF)-like protein/PAS domain S-box-containing protein